MARKAMQLVIELTVNYVPMPREHVHAWRAGLLLLLQMLKAEDLHNTPSRKFHWITRTVWATAN